MSGDFISLALWIVSAGATLLVVGLGILLSYHWIRFAMNTAATLIAIAVYSLVSLILLLSLFGAAAAYAL